MDHQLSLTQLQEEMIALWQLEFKLDNIGIHDNFFDLGGHSILAIDIIAQIEETTGRKLTLSVFYKYPTIKQLCDYIEHDELNITAKLLVAIKPSGTKRPIYLIHGIGLNVLNFSKLAAHMDPDQPVYGIQALGLSGASIPFKSMEEIAKQYVNEILEHDASGPYAIAGYSFGGYLAVEIRKQLTDIGKKVDLLAVFDTNAEDAIYNKPFKKIFLKKIQRQFPKLLYISRLFLKQPLHTINYQAFMIKNKAKSILRKYKPTEILRQEAYVDKIKEIVDKYNFAFRGYNLLPIDAEVILFKAAERVYFVEEAQTLGWKQFVRNDLKVYDIPGDHKTMFDMPNVSILANCLQTSLNQLV